MKHQRRRISMMNVQQGLFRIYVVVASVISAVALTITVTDALRPDRTVDPGAIAATAITLLFVWSLPPLIYAAIRWIIRGFRL